MIFFLFLFLSSAHAQEPVCVSKTNFAEREFSFQVRAETQPCLNNETKMFFEKDKERRYFLKPPEVPDTNTPTSLPRSP